MDLEKYFAEMKGYGILATADAAGNVNVAIYARPHTFPDGSIAFIMTERLTHQNLQSNPSAAYMFIEQGSGYKGVRLYLTKLREEKNSELLFKLRRREYSTEDANKNLYLVFFKVNRVLPLIGDKDLTEEE